MTNTKTYDFLKEDWHLHSHNSPCGKSSVGAIFNKAKEVGLKNFGITDHLHCPLNVPAIETSRKEFDVLNAPDNFHFGVESSCLRQFDLEENEKLGVAGRITARFHEGGPVFGPGSEPVIYLPDELCERLNFEYVIAGCHLHLKGGIDLMDSIRCYHRQYMFIAENSKVDVVAHPWWWNAWGSNRGNDFKKIPQSMHEEFAGALVENETSVEININAMLLNNSWEPQFREKYLDYLVLLKEHGVKFTIGSDSHDMYSMDFVVEHISEIKGYLDNLGITKDQIISPVAGR